jgi:hypothetical protein
MNVNELKKLFDEKLRTRDYLGMYELLNKYASECLDNSINNKELSIELIERSQDLLEYMGASKQFEMAFDLQNTLISNRNKLFLSCLKSEQQALKHLFLRIVGGDSST